MVTLKSDGSSFSGTIVSRDANSVTMTNQAGETKTFLTSELSGIRVDQPEAGRSHPASPSPGSPTPRGSPPALSGSQSTVAAGDAPALISFPSGTEFPLRNDGILDSCCVGMGSMSLGTLQQDTKGSDGKVVPAGANITLTLADEGWFNDHVEMFFEIGSADFGGHHYVVRAQSGKPGEGAVVRMFGAKENSPEAKSRGLFLHIEDQTYMTFKAASPVEFKLSQ